MECGGDRHYKIRSVYTADGLKGWALGAFKEKKSGFLSEIIGLVMPTFSTELYI